ncbi:replication initiator [Nonomuraea endophytica]|uniref:replication initiator n=1 Tax=Nonomuraea endophytica TaxID=714136 RepID=UPI0037C6FDDE
MITRESGNGAVSGLLGSVLSQNDMVALALERGVCIRPMAFRWTDRKDGTSRIVNVSCGSRWESVCAPCARRIRSARQEQCLEGWHLEAEPEGIMGQIGPDRTPDAEETAWMGEFREELILLRDAAMAEGDTAGAADWTQALAAHEAEMAYLGVPVGGGTAETASDDDDGGATVAAGQEVGGDWTQAPLPLEDAPWPTETDDGGAGAGESDGGGGADSPEESGRRVRSTARRQDAPELPKRAMTTGTVGRVFPGRAGRGYRPSMFVTLTMPGYGRVRDGVPVDPERYDYVRAARDLIHFSKLVDRFVQNLRRVTGRKVQYFAAVEPQRRLAPHLHMAVRGAIPRAELRAVAAATYHQVWWPPTDRGAIFDGEHTPVWQEGIGYVVPGTGEVLPTWEAALDELDGDPDAAPQHVVRLGEQLDIQGVLGGSADADQRARYLTKYLTKSVSDVMGGQEPDDDGGHDDGADGEVRQSGRRGGLRRARQAHARRLLEVLRWEPCSPRCANWLRYGVTPLEAGAGLVPGRCSGRAHQSAHLGYGGRRVLVSRAWSSRTLGGLLRDRRAWVAEALGVGDELSREADPGRYTWVRLKPGDPGVAPLAERLLWLIAEREQGREALERARLEQSGDGEQAAP